jgi:peptidoglycan/LPS O-acetylase OafA/YrhL
MYGVIGAYLSFYYSAIFVKYKKLCLLLGISILLIERLNFVYKIETFDTVYLYVFYFSIQSLGILLLIPYLSQLITGRGFIYKSITYLALISYSMYLLNFTLIANFVMPALLKFLDIETKSFVNSTIAYTLFLAITSMASILLYKFFERPIMDLRKTDARS